MLVLTRDIGQKIVIGDNVTVEVVGIQGTKVRLGVTAPRTIVVDREEVSERRKHNFEDTYVPRDRG